MLGAVASLLLLAGSPIEITWHGQSCFVMKTPGGTTVLMDPVAFEIGFKPPTVKADLVTISHEHPDHSNLKMVEVVGVDTGGASVIRGLTQKRDWAVVDESVGDVHVTTVHTFHDDERGKRWGKNAVFVFDVGKRRIVHLGDLGHLLDAAQIAAIGEVDVLMVPIGGGDYTLDAAEARAVIASLKPKSVILPMHYRTPVSRIKEIATREEYLALETNAVVIDSDTWKLTLDERTPAKPTVIFLEAE